MATGNISDPMMTNAIPQDIYNMFIAFALEYLLSRVIGWREQEESGFGGLMSPCLRSATGASITAV